MKRYYRRIAYEVEAPPGPHVGRVFVVYGFDLGLALRRIRALIGSENLWVRQSPAGRYDRARNEIVDDPAPVRREGRDA